jgi:dTDP-4-amino-4,6-dideoxygalactose transaminase
VFADLELETFNLDPAAVEAAVTPRTRALIPVHFAGLPARMDALSAIASRYQLALIEDAAHAHGAEVRGQRVGALGDAGVFSFQSTKNLTCGEGGMILTNDDALAARCWSAHNCGRRPDRAWYEHFVIGGNYRLGELQGALLNAQWERFEEQARRREQHGKYLAAELERLPGIYPQARGPECGRHAYHLFALRLDPHELGVSRSAFLEALVAEGIPASGGYPLPLYRQPLFEQMALGPYTGCRIGRPELDYHRTVCPNSETLCASQAVWLEQHLLLGSREDIDTIVEAFAKVHRHRDQLAAQAAPGGAPQV